MRRIGNGLHVSDSLLLHTKYLDEHSVRDTVSLSDLFFVLVHDMFVLHIPVPDSSVQEIDIENNQFMIQWVILTPEEVSGKLNGGTLTETAMKELWDKKGKAKVKSHKYVILHNHFMTMSFYDVNLMLLNSFHDPLVKEVLKKKGKRR